MEIKYKYLRKTAGLTQAEIAKSLNVKENTYTKWELLINDMPIDVCNKLANIYNVSIDYLLGLSKTKNYDDSSNNIDYKILCQRLKILREKQGLNKKQLAINIRFKPATYNAYERGTNIPSTFSLIIIANYYHCSIDYLLGKTNPPVQEESEQEETKQNYLKFKELRKEHKLTQTDIAKILNIEFKLYSKYETLVNDIPLDRCNTLVNYYNVSFDYILGLSNTLQYEKHNNKINFDIMRKRLKELRKKNNLSQTALANKVGIIQTTYSGYERGENIPTTFKLLDIVSYYHVSMDFILGRCDSDYLNN